MVGKFEEILRHIEGRGVLRGEPSAYRSKRMAPYVEGKERIGGVWVDFFDERLMVSRLLRAMRFLKAFLKAGELKTGKILFYGRPRLKGAIQGVLRPQDGYLVRSWGGGMLQDWDRKVLQPWSDYHRKPAYAIKRKEHYRMERFLKGMRPDTGLPQCVVFMRYRAAGLKECQEMGIPTVLLATSRVDRSKATYVVPVGGEGYYGQALFLSFYSTLLPRYRKSTTLFRVSKLFGNHLGRIRNSSFWERGGKVLELIESFFAVMKIRRDNP